MSSVSASFVMCEAVKTERDDRSSDHLYFMYGQKESIYHGHFYVCLFYAPWKKTDATASLNLADMGPDFSIFMCFFSRA